MSFVGNINDPLTNSTRNDLFALFLAALCAMTFAAFYLGRRRAVGLADGNWSELRSLPGHYGFFVALWTGLPALAAAVLWFLVSGGLISGLQAESGPGSGAIGLALALSIGCAGLAFARSRVTPAFSARESVERVVRALLFASSRR